MKLILTSTLCLAGGLLSLPIDALGQPASTRSLQTLSIQFDSLKSNTQSETNALKTALGHAQDKIKSLEEEIDNQQSCSTNFNGIWDGATCNIMMVENTAVNRQKIESVYFNTSQTSWKDYYTIPEVLSYCTYSALEVENRYTQCHGDWGGVGIFSKDISGYSGEAIRFIDFSSGCGSGGTRANKSDIRINGNKIQYRMDGGRASTTEIKRVTVKYECSRIIFKPAE